MTNTKQKHIPEFNETVLYAALKQIKAANDKADFALKYHDKLLDMVKELREVSSTTKTGNETNVKATALINEIEGKE